MVNMVEKSFMEKLVLFTVIPTFIGFLSPRGTLASTMSNEELRIGISQEFETLNPIIMSMVATNYLYYITGRTLNTLDSTGTWVPMLAVKIPNLADGSAKLTSDKKKLIAVWEIRETAKWSDGVPITCADFALSHEIARSPNVSVQEKDTYEQVEKIEWEKTKPRTCVFTYGRPRFDFYQMGSFYPVPRHLEESIFRKHGNEKSGYERNSNYTTRPTLDGLYSGPYKISEVKLGSHVTFALNPHFFGDPAKIKKVIIKLIPNTNALEANLRSGTIDKISVLGLNFDQAIALDKKIKNEQLPYIVSFKPSITYEHIDLNLDNPFLRDVRVRKALVFGINREEMVKALFENRQQVAAHNISPIDPWYTQDPKRITLYPYNRREAHRLLDDAGWKLNSKDGYRYKDGTKLSLQFGTTAGSNTREMVQTYLQNQWKEIGIEVIIKNEPARVFFGETLRRRKYSGLAMYSWVSAPESSPRSSLHSASIAQEKNGWSGQNSMNWTNKKVDEAIEKLESEFSLKRRIEYAHEILKHYTDEVPVIPLYYLSDVAVVPKNLQNFELTGHQFLETNNIEKWEITQ